MEEDFLIKSRRDVNNYIITFPVEAAGFEHIEHPVINLIVDNIVQVLQKKSQQRMGEISLNELDIQ
jgi:uncharacterized protein YgbK (DUF1537 family)